MCALPLGGCVEPAKAAMVPQTSLVHPLWAADRPDRPHRVLQVFSHGLEKFFLTRRPICVLCQMKCIEAGNCSLQHDRKHGVDVFLCVLHVSVKPVSLLLKYTCFPSLS